MFDTFLQHTQHRQQYYNMQLNTSTDSTQKETGYFSRTPLYA